MCSDWTGGEPVPTLFTPLSVFRGTIQMWEVFLFAARSTSTAANSTHLPSGEGTGSPTRFSFIMSSKVKGCLACEKAGREKKREQRRTRRKTRRRMACLRETRECSTADKVRGQIAEVKPHRLRLLTTVI